MNDAVKSHFDEYARRGEWQSFYLKSGANFSVPFQLRFEKFSEFLSQVAPKSVLDAGCGSGDFVAVMPNTVEIYRGIDLSEQMINSARDRFEADGNERKPFKISFDAVDILAYSPGETFDFVLASGLTEYFDDIEAVFSKLYALTTNGGFAAVQTPNRNFFRWKGQHKVLSADKGFAHHRLSYDELDALAERVGFRKVGGAFVNHVLIPYSLKMPLLHRMLDSIGQRLPNQVAEKRASMYVGFYVKR